MTNEKAKLALEDGTIFSGTAFGHIGEVTGEAVFNTSMTGYQEVLTDPSYTGQIVAMTYPHIGNYGVNQEDRESAGPCVEGFIVRSLCRTPSNYRSHATLDEYLRRHSIPGIEGIDTRALVRRLRSRGAMTAVLSSVDLDHQSLLQKARSAPKMTGRDLVRGVVPDKAFSWVESLSGNALTAHVLTPHHQERHVVALDYGLKWNILRCLTQLGCKVTVLPGTATAAQVLDYNPDGVFLSNGPGDPEPLTYGTVQKACRENQGAFRAGARGAWHQAAPV